MAHEKYFTLRIFFSQIKYCIAFYALWLLNYTNSSKISTASLLIMHSQYLLANQPERILPGFIDDKYALQPDFIDANANQSTFVNLCPKMNIKFSSEQNRQSSFAGYYESIYLEISSFFDFEGSQAQLLAFKYFNNSQTQQSQPKYIRHINSSPASLRKLSKSSEQYLKFGEGNSRNWKFYPRSFSTINLPRLSLADDGYVFRFLCFVTPIFDQNKSSDLQENETSLESLKNDFFDRFHGPCNANLSEIACRARNKKWSIYVPSLDNLIAEETKNNSENNQTEPNTVDQNSLSVADKSLKFKICRNKLFAKYINKIVVDKNTFPPTLQCQLSTFSPSLNRNPALHISFVWYLDQGLKTEKVVNMTGVKKFLALDAIDDNFKSISCGVNFYEAMIDDKKTQMNYLCTSKYLKTESLNRIRHSDFFGIKETDSYMRWTAMFIILFSTIILIAGIIIYKKNSSRREVYNKYNTSGKLTPNESDDLVAELVLNEIDSPL